MRAKTLIQMVPRQCMNEEAMRQWKVLSKIYLDNNDLLTEDFLHFKKGVHAQTVWQWFQDTYPDFSIVEARYSDVVKKYGHYT